MNKVITQETTLTNFIPFLDQKEKDSLKTSIEVIENITQSMRTNDIVNNRLTMDELVNAMTALSVLCRN